MATTAQRDWRSRPAVRFAVLIVGFQVVALLAVTAAELVPDGWIVDELEYGYETGALTETKVSGQRTGGLTDHYGECVLLGMGLGESEDLSLFERAALSPNLHHCVTMAEQLDRMSRGLDPQPALKIRYWNGTSVLTRPLIPLIGVRGVRTLSVALLVVACVALAGFVGRTSGRWAAAGFVAPLATADLVGLVEVFHHPLMIAIGLFGVVALGRAAIAGRDDQRIAEIAVLVGSAYSFFDLMNFVTGIMALSITVVGLCSPHLDRRARIRRMVTTGGAWASGYVLTWAAKWAFAAIASSPRQVWDVVADQFLFRLGGDHEALSGRFGAGFERTLETWLDPRLTKLLVLAALVVLVWAAVRVRPEDRLDAIVLAAPALLPVVFMLVANNHHEAHHWFEFRNLALSLSIVLMVAGHFAGGATPTSAGAGRSGPPRDSAAPVGRG